MSNDTRTLLLSQGYEPMRVVSWQRAVTLLALGKVEVIEHYDRLLRAVTCAMPAPAVVRLLRGFRHYDKAPKFSRVNIAVRDHYQCQYCGRRCSIAELTYDHVLPRSRGGATSWEKIVSACVACNSRKANRTPAEANMQLRQVPCRPKGHLATRLVLSTQSVPDAWRDYLYWTVELSSSAN